MEVGEFTEPAFKSQYFDYGRRLIANVFFIGAAINPGCLCYENDWMSKDELDLTLVSAQQEAQRFVGQTHESFAGETFKVLEVNDVKISAPSRLRGRDGDVQAYFITRGRINYQTYFQLIECKGSIDGELAYPNVNWDRSPSFYSCEEVGTMPNVKAQRRARREEVANQSANRRAQVRHNRKKVAECMKRCKKARRNMDIRSRTSEVQSNEAILNNFPVELGFEHSKGSCKKICND